MTHRSPEQTNRYDGPKFVDHRDGTQLENKSCHPLERSDDMLFPLPTGGEEIILSRLNLQEPHQGSISSDPIRHARACVEDQGDLLCRLSNINLPHVEQVPQGQRGAQDS